MRFRFRLRALIAAMAALLVGFASPALAQGGGGGGSTGFVLPTASQLDSSPCAGMTSWTPSVQDLGSGPVVVLDVGVYNGCVDGGARPDKLGSVGLTMTDTATGAFISRSVIMASYGERTYRFYLGTATVTLPARTLTFDMYKANGKLEILRSASLAETVEAALAARPAA